ncbi:hypothetical protein D9M71_704360 [compost metagenome]
MDRDAAGGPRQPESAFDPLGGDHQFGLGQLGEQLGQEFAGDALEFCQVADTGFFHGSGGTRQVKQAVEAVFDACTDEGHG